MKIPLHLIKEFERIEKETVIFHAEELGYSNTAMVAKNFHMPFPCMYIRLRKPYKMEDRLVHYLRLIDTTRNTFSGKNMAQYSVVSNDFKDAVAFDILDTGEIVVKAIDVEKYSPEIVSKMSTEEAKELLFPKKEKYLYNLVYDIISTIDHLNSTKYVVTEHTTDSQTGERLPSRKVERRIKIKQEKIRYSDSTTHSSGTKHRYKYRVRGHWRNLESGERVWIKDHVRGGDGTIFIPKEYEITD